MPKFQIFTTSNQVANIPAQDTVFLRLIATDRNSVSVLMVDKKGKKIPFGYIMTFDEYGIVTHHSVNENQGLDLKENGEIKIMSTEEYDRLRMDEEEPYYEEPDI